MATRLIGKDFTPPDVRAKVTGQAKYAEDYRAEGMLFAKLLLSPMPHGHVASIDTSKAMAMDGVVAILTAADVPQFDPPQDPILTNEPTFAGDPILAVAAVNEEIAAAAVEAIQVNLQQLPFTIDPVKSLYPGGPNARTGGNVNAGGKLQTVKWPAAAFTGVDQGKLPQGEPTQTWAFGDLSAGFGKAKVVVEDSFVTAGVAHQALEPRSCMAYWQNGRCFLYGSTQSQALCQAALPQLLGISQDQLVLVAEFCGGGFGGKSTDYPQMAIPAYLSKKAGRPVMMRVTRAEEARFAARPGFQGNAKIGFADDGRVTAIDLYIVQDNGPNSGFSDYTAAADAVSVIYQPEAMRFRGISVVTNTPMRTAQRGPGTNQIAMALEPFVDRAAQQLGLDRVAIRKVNAPDANGKVGAKQGPVTSAFQKEALDQGAQLFNWADRVKQSGTRQGNKVIGVGVGQAYHASGYSGFDGLVVIKPDGKLYVHTGVGNLGTYSYATTARAAAEVLGYDWDNVVIVWGNSDQHLPWNFGQFSSNTTYTETRTNYAAAQDAKAKLLGIAANDMGGTPDGYELQNEHVVSKTDPSKSMSFADAAKRAIALGSVYSGELVPQSNANEPVPVPYQQPPGTGPGINPMTAASVAALAGTGLIGVAKDTLPLNGTVPALAAGFAQVAIDVETGEVEILDYVGVADCGVVAHPRGAEVQAGAAAIQGIGLARFERLIYDPQIGLPGHLEYYRSKPPTVLDIPLAMNIGAVGKPDPSNPYGIKGIGEPVEGCAAAAVLCAISDALGGHYFNRTPITRDYIINALAKRPQATAPLAINTE